MTPISSSMTLRHPNHTSCEVVDAALGRSRHKIEC